MFPISDRMAAALRQSFVTSCTADVYFNGSYQATVPITDGSVTVDRTASVRRQCTLTIGDPSFVPLYVNSPLAPYGAELRIFLGISYMAGDEEQVPLGVFRIQEAKWDEATGSLPVIAASDRSQMLIDADFLMPLNAAGLSAIKLMTRLVGDITDADTLFDRSLVDYTIPGGTVYDSKRWDAIGTLAAGMGAEAYFDVFGNFVCVPIPSLTQANTSADAAWTVDAGPNGVLVAAQRGISRTGVYNAVAAQGVASGSSTPPVGYAADTDPRSPTYWGPASALPYGPYAKTSFGQVTYRYTNNVLTSGTQCTVAAQAQLANYLGLARSLDFTSVPNPALDAGDIILVQFLSGQKELHLIDKLTIPFGGSGTFGGTTRTLTYQSSGGS